MAVEQLITEHMETWTGAVLDKKASGRGAGSRRELYGIWKLRELIFELAGQGLLCGDASNGDAVEEPISNFAELVMGQAPPGAECNMEGRGTVFVKTGEFGVLYPEVKEWTTKPLKLARKGDVLICVVGATVGKLNLGIDCAIGRSVAAIRPSEAVETKYLYYALHPFVIKIRNSSKGSAQGVIGKSILNAVKIRVPDIEEQHRIVAKVDELMALCDQLEQQQESSLNAHQTLVKTLLDALTSATEREGFDTAWARIAAHFHTLFTTPDSIQQLRQALLQLAVTGKLVPQLAEESSAHELLEEIQSIGGLKGNSAYKKRLRSALRLQADKAFSLPENWTHVRLCELGEFGGGKTPSKSNPEYWGGNIPWVSPKDMKQARIQDSEDHVTNTAVSEGLTLYPQGAVLFVARSGILRRAFPVSIAEVDLTVNQDLKVLTLFKPQMAKYIQLMMNGFEQHILNCLTKTGTTVESLRFDDFAAYPFILPPIKEQARIVAKVDELMALCDRLEAAIEAAQTTRLQLADAVAQQAVAA